MKKIIKLVLFVLAACIILNLCVFSYHVFRAVLLYNLVATAKPQTIEWAAKNVKFINKKFYIPVKFFDHYRLMDRAVIYKAAMQTNYPEVIEILIKNGVNINEESSFNFMYPLEMAVSFNKNPEIFKVFIKHNAKPYNTRGEFLLITDAIIYNRNPEILRELLKYENIKNHYKKSISDYSKFHTITKAQYGIEDKLKILMDNGFDINEKPNKNPNSYYYGKTILDVLKEENQNGRNDYLIEVFEKYSKQKN